MKRKDRSLRVRAIAKEAPSSFRYRLLIELTLVAFIAISGARLYDLLASAIK